MGKLRVFFTIALIVVLLPLSAFGRHKKGDIVQDPNHRETRSHTDGFRRNNANYWNKREICRFYLYSSIIWFCPVLEELGK